jgi:hypothetical protein
VTHQVMVMKWETHNTFTKAISTKHLRLPKLISKMFAPKNTFTASMFGIAILLTKVHSEVSTSSCGDLGWTNAASFGSTLVCGESEVGTCQGLKTQAAANTACLAYGARLCTYSELLNDETRGTGCGLDPSLVWSSTACGTGGFELSYGGSAVGVYSTCTDETETHYVRCCADVFDSSLLSLPSAAPTVSPTSAPTEAPTQAPTNGPTPVPSFAPTSRPTFAPTSSPTFAPTSSPTSSPTVSPTINLSNETLNSNYTLSPTAVPSSMPTSLPSAVPTTLPSWSPTPMPSRIPTPSPTLVPTKAPTNIPTLFTTNPPTTSSSDAKLRGTSSNKQTSPMSLFDQNTSVTIGGVAVILLIAAVLVVVARSFINKKSSAAEPSK